MNEALRTPAFFMATIPPAILAVMALDLADLLDQDEKCMFCFGDGSWFDGFVGDTEIHVPCFFCFGTGKDGMGGGPLNPTTH